MSHERHPIRWLIWSLAAIFFFYEFVLRVAPGLVVDQLMATYHATAGLVGLLVAAYLWVYAPMQIPVGLLMDRYGARKLLTLGTFCCGLGTLLFALAFQYWLGLTSRALIGFGSSFAFVGMVYVSSHWFSGRMTTILIGFGNSIGMLGAMWGEAILGYLDGVFGWRLVTALLAALGLLLALAIYWLFQKYPGPAETKNDRAESFATVWVNLKRVLSNGQTWICAGVSFLIYLSTVAFAGLWAPSFLQVVYGYGIGKAGLATSMFYFGWVVGGPIIGSLTGRTTSRKSLISVCATLAGVAMLVIIFIPTIDTFSLFALLFLIGALSSAQLLTFSYAILVNPEKAKGTAVAFTNFAVMAAGAVAQPVIGWLLDAHATSVTTGEPVVITGPDFQYAMTLFPISFFLGAVLALFMKRASRLQLESR